MTAAITLHQPYATLIASGQKRIETRSWKPPAALIGERLLVHAAARTPGHGKIGAYHFDTDTDGVPIMWESAPTDADGNNLPGFQLPTMVHLGAIVASCVLAAAVPMVGGSDLDRPIRDLLAEHDGRFFAVDATGNLADWHRRPGLDGPEGAMRTAHADQLPYGDFAPGRWAWILDDVKPTTERCPACWLEVDPAMYASDWDIPRPDCDHCGDEGYTSPIPAKGHQRIWEWTP